MLLKKIYNIKNVVQFPTEYYNELSRNLIENCNHVQHYYIIVNTYL